MGRRNKTQKLKKKNKKKQRKRQANTNWRDQVGNPGGDLQSTVEEQPGQGSTGQGGSPSVGWLQQAVVWLIPRCFPKGLVAFLQAGRCCGSAGEA